MMEKALVNGITLAYERQGRGAPLVLLHGYPLDHTIWRPLVPLLEDHAELILPDLRGFGESDAPDNEYSLTDMAADVAALLDYLEIRQAAIVGHSMGGYIALLFAGQFPQRVKGLGLVASQAAADSPDRRRGRFETAEMVRLQGAGVVADAMPAKLTPDVALQSTLRRLIRQQRPMGIIGALKALAGRPDSNALLQDFHFPVVILHGLEDALIPIERAREVQQRVPQGHLVEIEAVGHMLMMEAPQVTAQALTTLL